MPTLLANGGPVMWLILIAAATAAVVFVERSLYCHRAQINSAEFLNGVRTVLKRGNVVEAISICDATPGPVARLVKAAILLSQPTIELDPFVARVDAERCDGCDGDGAGEREYVPVQIEVDPEREIGGNQPRQRGEQGVR